MESAKRIAARSSREEGEISLFALGTTLLRHRWRIGRWMLAGGLVAALFAFFRPALYVASGSFLPQGAADPSRSGLASLAGQLGVTIPQSNQTLSPEVYAKLLKSQVLLLAIARDTFPVQELGGRRVAFLDLVEIKGASTARREERGTKVLDKMVAAAVSKPTGLVEFTVSTKWRSVSLAIANELINGVNAYNGRTRQDQAGAERKFIEGRLAIAGADLRDAEDRMERFLQTNRNLGGSPELTMQRDRIQRDVSLRQQVFTSLTQSYEEARIREVRDTPVITVLEPPSVPTEPASRGRAIRVLIGLILGGVFGAFLAFASDMVARQRKDGDVEANAFADTLAEVKGEVLGPIARFRKRRPR
jgi:uncharacterized protein involved in exopolysaccharide biosynthesis